MDTTTAVQAYTRRTLNHLELLRASSKFTDITIRTENFPSMDFPAHRCLICSASTYFRAMLESERFVESGKDVVTIREVSNEAIRLLLEFVYSGKAALNVDNIADALKIGSMTQVDEFMMICEEFLMDSLDVDNIPDIWSYVVQYHLPSLQNYIIKFVGRYLLSVDQKVLLRFDADLLTLLLEEAVIITTEVNILTLVVQWVQFNFKCRENFAKNLLRLIFWDRIHSRDTRSIAAKSIKPLRIIINEASKKPCSTTPRGMIEGIILVGGFSINGPMNEVRFLPSWENRVDEFKWVTFDSLPTESRLVDFGLCGLPDGGFLICGGCCLNLEMKEIRSRSSFMFDAHAGRWKSIRKMNKVRSGCLAIWFRNFAYIFGGDVSEPGTYERYNICNNTWEFLGNLPVPFAAEGIAGCVVRSRIWISGGQVNKDQPTDRMWSYCPENNQWTEEPALPVTCSDHSLFCYKKRLYRVGGWSVSDFDRHYLQLSEVHSFAPETGWTTEQWKVPNSNAFQQFVLDGNRMVLIGGGSLKASQRFFRSPEEREKEKIELLWFDLDAGEWKGGKQSGVYSSFWDHKAIIGFLPRNLVLSNFTATLPSRRTQKRSTISI